MPKDLEGFLVVTLEQAVAAPYASSRLADDGARVIKLERAEGDFARNYDSYVNGQSAYFVWLNRGKESVLFDLKNAGDIQFLHRLLARADVFIQNLAPGATGRAGIGSAGLRMRYPRLITCDISGYGSFGPYRDAKAYDLLIQAESGLSLLTGNEQGPARVGVSVCDIACGMNAHRAIVQALFARERTGQGRGIEVSLFDSLADWMNVPYLQHQYGGHTPARMGLRHPTIAPYGEFTCRDGLSLLLSIQNEREWQALCTKALDAPQLVTHPHFVDGPTRVANRVELDAEIARIFSRFDRPDMAQRLRDAGIAFGQLSTLDDLHEHPQRRQIWIETPAGSVQMSAPPVVVVGERDQFGPVPALGAQDTAVRSEFDVPDAGLVKPY